MTILGIKTTATNTLTKSNDLDALFSDDSDDSSFSLDFSKTPNTLPSPTFMLPAPVPLSEQDRITSLEEALPRINNFLTKMKEINMAQSYIGDIYFIPENAAPIELSTLLFQLYRSINEKNEEETNLIYEDIISTDFSSFPETILAQIELIKFIKGEKTNLKDFLTSKVDSRILSIIHFVLSKDQDSKVSIFHLISSVEMMLKFPVLAPISCFFTGYNIQEILKQLSFELVSLFPHNPILPSCVEKISEFSPESKMALDLIPASDDSSEDFSSDFFESLKPNPLATPVIILHSNTDTNFLDFSSEASKPIITLTEPPTTVTFELENGSNQMGMPFFQNWVESLRACEYKSDFISKYMKNKEPSTFFHELPETPDISNISYHLPVIHLINSSSYSLIKRGCPYPDLLRIEFQFQDALLHNKVEMVNKSLSELCSYSEKVTVKQKKRHSKRSSEPFVCLKPLDSLRKLPNAIQEPNGQIEEALALSDIEIALHGRSLLILAPLCKISPDLIESKTIENSECRGYHLYQLYTQNNFSPYVSYRIAFALSLNTMERNLQLACNFLFEGLYVLLRALPLNMTPIARYGYLLSAEIFERMNSYYYSALMMDSFFITDTKDTSASMTLARIATKNNDHMRSAFYYTQLLKQYITRKMVDESIYISQVISIIYVENGLNDLAISLLEGMIDNSYNISFGSVTSRRQAGTLQTKKIKPLFPSAENLLNTSDIQVQQFKPNPQSLNTSLLALTLTDLLIGERMFDFAQSLLNKLQDGKQDRIKNFTNFMQCRLYYKQNRVKEFFDSLPKTDLKICLHRNSNPRLSIVFSSTFDTNASYLRMLANLCFRQRLYLDSLFWSEMIIHSTCKGSLKEFGYGNMLRGFCLFELWIRTRTKLELPSQLNKLQEPFGKFNLTWDSATRDFYSDSESESDSSPVSSNEISKNSLFSEAISSIYTAKQCFDRVGCYHLYLHCTLMLCDLFLSNSFNILYKKHKLDKNKDHLLQQHLLNLSIKPIRILTDLLNSKEQFQLPIQFNEFTITLDNIPSYFKTIEAIISKTLKPIDIIHYQVLRARYNFLKSDMDECNRYFEFAFSNLQRYFACGSEFIPKLLSQNKCHRIEMILEELIQLLFYFDFNFINDKLILFDILNNVRFLESNKKKSKVACNSDVINPTTDINQSFIAMANPNYPDFHSILSSYNISARGSSSLNNSLRIQSNLKNNSNNEIAFDDPYKSIEFYLHQIDSNVRLFEEEKMKEEDMTFKNRKLCQKIELAAETLRRQRQTDLPIETQYSYALRITPKAKNLVFVFRIFDKIGVYSPLNGFKKLIDIFNRKMMQPISIKIRGEVINDSISMFNSQFLEMFLSLTTTAFAKSVKVTHARRIQKDVANLIFSSIIESKSMPIVPDDHLLGGSRVFGKHLKGSLVTLDCGNEPIVLITTHDLSCLPYETMLKRQTIIRSTSFSRLLLRSNNSIQLSGRSSFRLSSNNYLPINPNSNNNGGNSNTTNSTTANTKEDNSINRHHDKDEGFEDYYYDDSAEKSGSSCQKKSKKKANMSNDETDSELEQTTKSKKFLIQPPSIVADPNRQKDNLKRKRSMSMTMARSGGKRSVTPPPNQMQPPQKSRSSSIKMMKSKSTSNTSLKRTSMLAEINIEELKSVVKPMIIRSRLEDPSRAVLPMNDFIYTFGGKNRFDYSLKIGHLDQSLSQPLFCSKESNEYYTAKFQFLSVVDEAKMVQILPNNLVLCAYDDLCELPEKLAKRMNDFRFTSFLFIPNIYFKEALKEIKKIFKRHERRMRYIMTHPNELNEQLNLLKDKYALLTTLQATLIQIFNFPFPLFTPLS